MNGYGGEHDAKEKERASALSFFVLRKNQRTMPVKAGMAYAKNLPLASFLNAAALTAVSDQGLCPWSLVAFEKAPQNFNCPAGLALW